MKDSNGLESKFREVLVVSRRAKELLKGSKPLVKTKEKHPLKIAIEELEKGKLGVKLIEKLEEKEISRNPQ
ncbi:MAG: DNA-directed RNA polymerase subunit omega [Candidatus Aminicenantia bacterium]